LKSQRIIRIIKEAKKYLTKDGLLILENEAGQSSVLSKLLKTEGYKVEETRKNHCLEERFIVSGRKKTLIIGGSGFLGSALADLSCLGSVELTYYANQRGKCEIFIDLLKANCIKKVVQKVKPDVIIHCGGLTSTDFCEMEKQLALDINFGGTQNLVEYFDGKIIYFSTDYVFDGEDAPYDEHSTPNPINHYGKTKLLAEKAVLEKPQNLVVRVSGLYGLNLINNKFFDSLMRSKKIESYIDLVSSPTYIRDISSAIPILLNTSGILHLSGKENYSRYNFIKRVVDSLGIHKEVVPVSYDPDKLKANRPRNSTLASVMDMATTSLDKALIEIKRNIT